MSNITEILVGGRYLPIASTEVKGLASFYDSHFDVIDGQVRIKQGYFKSLYEQYSTGVVRTLSLQATYSNSTLYHNLLELDGTVISSVEVTLPFNNYANKIDVSSIIDNVVTFKLLNNNTNTVLSTDTLSLSDYGTKLTVERAGTDITVKLLNNNTVLSSSTITLPTSETEFVPVYGEVDLDLDTDTYILTSYLKDTDGEIVSEAKVDLPLSLEMTMNTSTYILTSYLKTKAGNIVSQSSIDFPLESVVTDVKEEDGIITITLQNGNTASYDITDLVNGLVAEEDYDAKMEEIDTAIGNRYTKEETDTAISTAIAAAITTTLNTDVEV